MPDVPGQYASFGARAAAWVVDAVPHALVPYVVARATDSIVIGLAGFLVTGILWSILPEARHGMSPGKRIVAIHVVNLRDDSRLGLARAALRWIVKYGVGGVLPVSYLWYFRSPSHRTWHDYAAATAVHATPRVSDRRG